VEKIGRVIKIWQERNIFEKNYLVGLQKTLEERGEASFKSQKQPKPSYVAEGNDEGPRSHADFKISDLSLRVSALQSAEERRELAEGVVSKGFQLTHEYVDELRKKLKDLKPDDDAPNRFLESVDKLREQVASVSAERSENAKLISATEKAMGFYTGQGRDARVVAKAYKNFGERVKQFPSRIDEKMESLPEPSPVPSPDVNAPSPNVSGGSSPRSVSDDECRVESVVKFTGGTASFLGSSTMQKLLEDVRRGKKDDADSHRSRIVRDFCYFLNVFFAFRLFEVLCMSLIAYLLNPLPPLNMSRLPILIITKHQCLFD
jgi:hypothetical protein